jgi:bisphosphoglycerate-independent phosphoglycerate mutase (AlkP superfamily)
MEAVFFFETLVLIHEIISQHNLEGNNILINFVCRVAKVKGHVTIMGPSSVQSVHAVSVALTASCPVSTGAPIRRSKAAGA